MYSQVILVGLVGDTLNSRFRDVLVMDEEQANEPTDVPQDEPSSESPTYRDISPDELQRILEDHKKWVESEGKEGKPAELNEANLRKATLTFANLQEAHLQGTNLQMANLGKANLQSCDLSQSILASAHFHDAILQNANLQNANLTNAKGLLAGQLAGTNVSGATLPEEIRDFNGLGQVKDLSQSAKRLFISMLLGCVYCWLTVATTTDFALVTNSSSSPLPIIQAQIPIVGFYLAAPLILLSIYFWFHLYLQKLWERLSLLPAIFPDGERLDQKVTWLIGDRVQAHVPLLKKERPAMSKFQNAISIILAWWVVPLTLGLMWGRFLTRHDWCITAPHIFLIGVAAWSGVWFFELAKQTLSGQKIPAKTFNEFVRQVTVYKHHAVQFALGLLFIVSIGALYSPFEKTPAVYKYLFLGYSPFADLENQEFSIKPANWPQDRDKQMEVLNTVKGAKLKKQNFQFANLKGAFLVWADLEKANLRGAWLVGTKLMKARLHGAKLQNALMRHVKLQEAFLQGANLQKADLYWANLQGANLKEADLEGADLEGTHLLMANLTNASLLDVKNLIQAKLDAACSDGGTKLPPKLKPPPPCPK